MVGLIAVWVLSAAPEANAPHAVGEKPRLAVLDLAVAGGIDPSLGAALSQAIATEISSRGLFEVISSTEISAILGAERQKVLAGCSDEASACQAEVAGALNARFTLSGTIAKLGDAYQLTLQMIDTERARPVGRSSRIAKSLDEFRAALPYATAEATGMPLPPPPARWPAVLAYVGAGICAVGGLNFALQAFGTETSIKHEFSNGRLNPLGLRTYAEYQADLNDASLNRALALTALVATAVFAIAGTAWLYFTGQIFGHNTPVVALAPNSVSLGWSFER